MENAALYTVASVVGTIAAVLVGAGVFRRVQAIVLPLEEQP